MKDQIQKRAKEIGDAPSGVGTMTYRQWLVGKALSEMLPKRPFSTMNTILYVTPIVEANLLALAEAEMKEVSNG